MISLILRNGILSLPDTDKAASYCVLKSDIGCKYFFIASLLAIGILDSCNGILNGNNQNY